MPAAVSRHGRWGLPDCPNRSMVMADRRRGKGDCDLERALGASLPESESDPLAPLNIACDSAGPPVHMSQVCHTREEHMYM